MRALLTAVAVVPLLVGCAQVPKPSAYSFSYQKKMQAAHHWELLARDVAKGVALEYAGLVDGGVYVEPGTGVFGSTTTTWANVPLPSTTIGSGVDDPGRDSSTVDPGGNPAPKAVTV